MECTNKEMKMMKKLTICINCKHCHSMSGDPHTAVCYAPEVIEKRICFVSGKKRPVPPCTYINTRGKCKFYEEK